MLTGDGHVRHVPSSFRPVTSNDNVHVVVDGFQAISDRWILLRRVVAEVVPSNEARKHLVGLRADLAIVLGICTTMPRQ